MDSKLRDPMTYFTSRLNMVCSDVQERVSCGPEDGSTDDRATCQAYGCCFVESTSSSPSCFRSTHKPVAIMHGMGSRPASYQKNIDWLREAYPGIYVKNMNIYPGPPSQSTGMEEQMDLTVRAIKVSERKQIKCASRDRHLFTYTFGASKKTVGRPHA